jgi:hypothetical protein
MIAVHADGPFQVATLLWRPASGAHALTVVCKATFVLSPHKAVLAAEQEPPNEDDDHWDDDASRSLHAPSDVVPYKPRVDVLLTGNACAPGRRPVRALSVRLRVGTVDKTVEVHGDRTLAPDGSAREAAGFLRMPLRYERAAGGPGTANPVGVRPYTTDATGAFVLPNLQPPGLVPRGPGDVIPPVGFGPFAPAWPERIAKLGRGVLGAGWTERPLPAELDPSFWNAAPIDQQLEALHDDQRITIENAHPEHARLRTALPGLRPRARATRGAATEEIELVADTLLIDADRGTCSVVWRGQLALASRDEAVRVLVDTAPPRDVERPRRPVIESPETVDAGTRAMAFPIAATALPDGALPFAPAVASAIVEPPPRPSYAPPPPPPTRLVPPELASSGTPFVPPAAPSSIGFEAPRSVRPPMPTPPEAMPHSARAPTPPSAAHLSAVAASNAAADVRVAPASTRLATRSPAQRPAEVVKVVWVDAAIGPHLDRATALARVLLESDLAPAATVDEAMRAKPEGAADRVARRAAAALARGEAADEAGLGALRAAAVSEDGVFEPPIAVCAGELELPLDEVEVLKATLAAVSPLSRGDKKVEELVASVGDAVASGSLEGAGGLATELGRQVLEAYAQGKRAVGVDQLVSQVERVVVRRRGFQRRPVFGEERLRALLAVRGAREAVPAYLPAAIVDELPMGARFPVRLLARVDARQDPDEASPIALRVDAIAIVVDTR